jgi:type II secretory pathway component PulK
MDTDELHGRSVKQDAGFVLIAVIWLAGLLAVVATAFIIAVRSNNLMSSNTAQGAQAELAADGLVRLTMARLVDGGVARRNGEVFVCRWSSDIVAEISVQDQGGLLDINTAVPDLVLAVLRGLGARADDVPGIAAAIQDYRDVDRQSADGGAEPALYQFQTFGPKNAPLDAPEELDQVPEISDELLFKLLPLVSTQSQQTGFDMAVAPMVLKRALAAGGLSDTDLLKFSSPTAAKVFAIDVVATPKNGARYRRVALVALTGQQERPIATLAWQRGRAPAGVVEIVRAGERDCFTQ